MKIKFLLGILGLTSLLILPNCARYQPTPLPYPAGFSQETDGVQIVTRKLSEQESKACFDSEDVNIKYDTIQMYIKNNSKDPVVLSANKIDLPLESRKEVSKYIYRNTVGRAGGYAAAGLVLWPFLIPAVVDGTKSSKANYKVDCDAKVKILGQNDTEIINSGCSVNKVFFVPKELATQQFNLSIIKQNSSETLSFTCEI